MNEQTKEELEVEAKISEIESIIYSINKTGISRIDELDIQIDEIQELIHQIKEIEGE